MLRIAMILFVQSITPTSLAVHTTGEGCDCGCPHDPSSGWATHVVDMKHKVVCCQRDSCAGGGLSEWKLAFFDIADPAATPECVVEQVLWRCATTEYVLGRWCEEVCAEMDVLEEAECGCSVAETFASGPCDEDQVLTMSP